MRHFWMLLVFCGLASCNLWVSKDKKTQEMVDQEIQAIDWNNVDNYPLFENCDETASKIGQRECFEQELLSHFSATLTEFEFILGSEIDSTITVDFLVDKEGKITILEIVKDNEIDGQMPEFEGIVRQSLKNMPPLAPALKRGIPVSAKFRLPIRLRSN
ncbi:energy transducer TonB [Ulvibacterium marinum]|nr:energy transducer TonB [Ulvibacterium marinum]